MATTVTEAVVRRDGVRQLAVSQSAAENGLILANADTAMRIVVVGVLGCITADGTLQFLSGTDILSGAMDLAGKTGIAWRGSSRQPLYECGPGKDLKITTVTGAFRGSFLVRLVPGA